MRTAVALFLVALELGCSTSDGRPTPAPPASAVPDSGGVFAWTEAAPCPIPRFEALGLVVENELWVMGGFLSSALNVTKRIDIYNPSTDSWRLGPELPDAETHVGVANVDGDIVLVGGFVGNVLERVTSAGVWRRKPADGTWAPGPALPTPRAAVAMALVGTEIHAAGGLAADGDTDSGEHVVWDLAGDSAWTSAAPLSNARNHGGGATSGGLFFAVAGRHAWDEKTGHDPALDAFDPATGAWSARAPMTVARSEIGASTVTMPDGRLLVVGGSIAGKNPSDDVLVYDPALDAWSALLALPSPRKGAVAARIGAKIIVTTGSPTSTDPSAVTWVGCCL